MEYTITDKEIEEAFKGTDFGSMENIEVLRYGVLKCASGYHQGSTSTAVLNELGLTTKKYTLTRKGKYFLWEWWSKGSNF